MRKILLLVWLAASAVNAEIVDGVAAVVNDKVITYSDVRDYIQPVIAQLRRNYSGPELVEKVKASQMDALNNLIERQLILDEFKQKGFSFPETVIDEQLNEVIQTDFGGDRAAFIKTLEAENITLNRYREQIRERTIVQAMRNRKVQNEVVASPYKIEQYYRERQDEFREEDQIKLRMILIRKTKDAEAAATTPIPAPVAVETAEAAPAPAPAAAEARKAMAEEILGKLKAGDSFESLAKLYSDGKEGAKGGDWGWIKRDELRKELSEPAFALPAGQHSGIIETADGYYILQVEDAKAARIRPLAEVRDTIEKQLLQEQRAKMQQAWVQQLRSKAYIRMF